MGRKASRKAAGAEKQAAAPQKRVRCCQHSLQASSSSKRGALLAERPLEAGEAGGQGRCGRQEGKQAQLLVHGLMHGLTQLEIKAELTEAWADAFEARWGRERSEQRAASLHCRLARQSAGRGATDVRRRPTLAHFESVTPYASTLHPSTPRSSFLPSFLRTNVRRVTSTASIYQPTSQPD